jgi:hypothetical protein
LKKIGGMEFYDVHYHKFKLNIENHDPSLNISFTKNYRDVTEWVNSTKFKVLSKIVILKKIKNYLIK